MLFTGEALSWRHEAEVLEVELHRAPLNEMGTTTLSELEVLARYLRGGAGGARALIFWSSRPGFCAGADLRELHAGLVARRDRWDRVTDRLGPLAGAALGRVRSRLVRREVRRFLDGLTRCSTRSTRPASSRSLR